MFKFNGKYNNSKELKVRRGKALDALFWLTGTNEECQPNTFLYKDIVIIYDVIESLPENGYLSETTSVEFDEKEPNEDCSDMEEELLDLHPTNSGEIVCSEHTKIGSFPPGNYATEKQKFIINKEMLNAQTHEFNTEYLASLSFPTLFPDAKADPTNSYLLREISNYETAICR